MPCLNCIYTVVYVKRVKNSVPLFYADAEMLDAGTLDAATTME